MIQKSLEPIVADKIEIGVEKEQRFHQQRIGQIHPHRGHTLFEINLATGLIVPATFEEIDYVVGSDFKSGAIKKKIIIQPDCFYISALNKRNVLKKFMKGESGDKFK